MKGNPLYAYAGIAVVGIALIIVLSIIGVGQKEELLAGGNEETPTQDSGGSSLGEETYKTSCVHCHGENFDGMGVNFSGLADRYSKDDVMKIITEGIPGTSMPGGLVTDEAKKEALADYLLEATK